jgi:hypothetical protein
MKPQLPYADFEFLRGLQADHAVGEDFLNTRVQSMNVPNTEKARRKKKEADDQRWDGKPKEQFAIHYWAVSDDVGERANAECRAFRPKSTRCC